MIIQALRQFFNSMAVPGENDDLMDYEIFYLHRYGMLRVFNNFSCEKCDYFMILKDTLYNFYANIFQVKLMVAAGFCRH